MCSLNRFIKIDFRLLAFIAFVFCSSSCTNNKDTYSIIDFGAKADSTIINTKFINDAIHTCNKNGGGTVIVPSGTYSTGTIELLSNVNLHLEAGAKLMGSRDTSDYKPMPNILFDEGYNRYGLIYAVEAKNISITGQGEINGNGTYFMNGIDKPHMGHDWDRKYVRQGEAYMKDGEIFEDGPVSYNFRPGMLLFIERCENVKILDVSLNDSPEWTVRLQDSDNAEFRGVTIETNPLIPNSDGIHCTSSRNIRISDCHIFAGDDAIIVTGFGEGIMPGDSIDEAKFIGNKTGYAENVVVTNCVLSSRSACIRVGYGQHPIRNLIFSNIIMHSSNRGIGVFARDNSSIENVLFDNIIIQTRLHSGHWWGKGEAIHVSAVKDTELGKVGTINNVRFSNIIATSETGMLVYGSEESIIENISFQNVQLTINNGKYTETYGGNFDLRPAASKDKALFKHDVPGFYAQHVKNLSLTGLKVTWSEGLPDFFTNGVEINHFDGLRIENFTGGPVFTRKGLSAIKLSNGIHAELKLNTNTTLQKENVK